MEQVVFFCSGGDLTTVPHIATHEGGYKIRLIMQNNLSRLQSLPLITLAVVQGRALGGGAELTTAFDFRLMTESAKIGFVHVKLEITVGWGGGSRLVQIVGPTKAIELMASGKFLSPEEALKIGLINGVLTDCVEEDIDDVLVKARDWIKPYIAASSGTLHAIKSIVNNATWLPLSDALRKEMDLFASVWGGEAHKKAITQNIKHK